MTYFSVDVETSGLVPGRHTLLSVGVVELTSNAQFYAVLDHRDKDWGVPKIEWDHGTRDWFKEQEAAYDCLFGTHDAFLDQPITRQKPSDVACKLADWVESFPKPRTFVAWPASFDKPWLDILFHAAGVTNPFDYRTVDIKSWICGRFGGGPEVGRDQLPAEAQALYVDPEFPHHALADAVAQAETMRLLLGM